MIKEAIQLIIDQALSAAKVEPLVINGRSYLPTRTPTYLVKDPEAETIEVSTLQGIVDYIEANRDGHDLKDLIVHVVGPRDVNVLGALDENHERQTWLSASPADSGLDAFFGLAREHENFMVTLLTRFEDTPERAALLATIGNVTVGDVRTLADDGVTQEVISKSGAARFGTTTIKNPVLLAPRTSFPEIFLPACPYVLRAQARDGKMPLLTLHEGEEGASNVAAITAIGRWLKRELPEGVAIIA